MFLSCSKKLLPGLVSQSSVSLPARLRPFARGGFTLIELMFVVAIVAILLALAYPAYQDSVRKSRRADATSSLMGLAQTLERCFTRFNSYAHDDCPDLPDTSDKGYYSLSVERDATTFTVTAEATGDQVNDACGDFTVDHLGNKTPGPDSNRCWGSLGSS